MLYPPFCATLFLSPHGRFEPSAQARARAAADGNSRADDLIPIYRRRTQVDPGGKETETRMRYFVVDGVDALKKFGDDAW